MENPVTRWYADKDHVEEMLGWNPTLKEWEKSVAGHFPAGARLLDVGCGLGREAFALSNSSAVKPYFSAWRAMPTIALTASSILLSFTAAPRRPISIVSQTFWSE